MLSGASTVPKQRGMHTDIRIYGTEGVIWFDCEAGRARLELSRLDGTNEVYAMAPSEAEYDGTLPVTHFAALCAGKPVGNPANGDIIGGKNGVPRGLYTTRPLAAAPRFGFSWSGFGSTT